MKKVQNYINGNITSNSSRFLDVEDPSTGEIISKVVLSDQDDFDKTIISSNNAFEKWSEITPLKRSRIISKYKENIEKDIQAIVNKELQRILK